MFEDQLEFLPELAGQLGRPVEGNRNESIKLVPQLIKVGPLELGVEIDDDVQAGSGDVVGLLMVEFVQGSQQAAGQVVQPQGVVELGDHLVGRGFWGQSQDGDSVASLLLELPDILDDPRHGLRHMIFIQDDDPGAVPLSESLQRAVDRANVLEGHLAGSGLNDLLPGQGGVEPLVLLGDGPADSLGVEHGHAGCGLQLGGGQLEGRALAGRGDGQGQQDYQGRHIIYLMWEWIFGADESKELKEDDRNYWKYDYIAQYLVSPMWRSPVMEFVDEHCAMFENTEENKLEYTGVHKKFKRMIELQLTHLF